MRQSGRETHQRQRGGLPRLWSVLPTPLPARLLPRGSISPGEGHRAAAQTGCGSRAGAVWELWGHPGKCRGPHFTSVLLQASLSTSREENWESQNHTQTTHKPRHANHMPKRGTARTDWGPQSQPECWVPGATNPRPQAPRATNTFCTHSPRVPSKGKSSDVTARRSLRASG